MAIRLALVIAPIAGLATLGLATGCVHNESPSRLATPTRPAAEAATGDAHVGAAGGEEISARHRLLAVDPLARRNRVRLPQGYVADGDEYVSRVRICVTESGDVEDVAVLEPSIPAIDEQLPEVIAQWHYRPLVIDGQATAFCYPMSYRVH